jgi:hypothetical protein
MSLRWKSVCTATLAAAILSALPSSAQEHEMTYHTLAPCLVLDTRVAGGAFAAGETRTYNVTGDLSSQGGPSTGCGVPGFSNGIAQAQAVAVNIIALFPAGSGNIAAHAADQAMTGSVVNFTLNENVSNTTPVAIAQTTGVGDFKVQVNNSSTHVLIRVVGYYAKPIQTVHVHPVPGNHTASGTNLLNALAAITNASSTKHYVLKLEPGIYDVGSTPVQMKDYVDIEGSGQKATVIKGSGAPTQDAGVVQGAHQAELRDLQVDCTADTAPTCVAVFVPDDVETFLRDVTLLAKGANSNWGVRASGGHPWIEGATIRVEDGSFMNYGISTRNLSTPTIRSTVIDVESGTSRGYGIYFTNSSTPREVREVQITVSGNSSQAFGIDLDFGTFTAATITQSTILVEGAFTTTGVRQNGASPSLTIEQSQVRATGDNSTGVESGATLTTIDHSVIAGESMTVFGGTVLIGATRLHGGSVLGSITCAGVYDESFTFFPGPACP